MKIKSPNPYYIIVFILLVIFSLITIVVSTQQKTQDIRSRASQKTCATDKGCAFTEKCTRTSCNARFCPGVCTPDPERSKFKYVAIPKASRCTYDPPGASIRHTGFCLDANKINDVVCKNVEKFPKSICYNEIDPKASGNPLCKISGKAVPCCKPTQKCCDLILETSCKIKIESAPSPTPSCTKAGAYCERGTIDSCCGRSTCIATSNQPRLGVCLLPNGEKCSSKGQCRSNYCSSGRCRTKPKSTATPTPRKSRSSSGSSTSGSGTGGSGARGSDNTRANNDKEKKTSSPPLSTAVRFEIKVADTKGKPINVQIGRAYCDANKEGSKARCELGFRKSNISSHNFPLGKVPSDKEFAGGLVNFGSQKLKLVRTIEDPNSSIIKNCHTFPNHYCGVWSKKSFEPGVYKVRFVFERVTEAVECALKSRGDANCDGKINLTDFEIWRRENKREISSRNADFNSNKKVDLEDFEIWRRNTKF